jgi:CDP-diacylglycerol--glycerol-3-phosphate 3-phosphatidyltransferase
MTSRNLAAAMNIANKLTLSRIAVIPFFMFALLFNRLSGDLTYIAIARYVALLLFIGASVTDYIDGLVARRLNLESKLGRLLDPLADKLLITAAFVSFVDLQIFPAWIVIVILCREFIVTGLRSLGSAQGRIIHADRWGKHKTLSQVLTVIATLLFLCGHDTLMLSGQWDSIIVKGWGLDWWLDLVLKILLYICAFFTVFSGSIYLLKNRDLLSDETRKLI